MKETKTEITSDLKPILQQTDKPHKQIAKNRIHAGNHNKRKWQQIYKRLFF